MAISPYIASLREHVGTGMLMLPGASAVVLDDADRILLAQSAESGRWSVIAGAIDPGEQPADAIIREIREETGLSVVIERLCGVVLHPVRYPNGDECQYLNVWFRCRAIAGEARVNDDESRAVAWFNASDLPELPPVAAMTIRRALSDDDAAWFAAPGAHDPTFGFIAAI